MLFGLISNDVAVPKDMVPPIDALPETVMPDATEIELLNVAAPLNSDVLCALSLPVT